MASQLFLEIINYEDHDIKNLYGYNSHSETNLEPCQNSKMERFVKVVNG